MNHYLTTIDLGDRHIHCYVMTDDVRVLPAVLDEMVSYAETIRKIWPPIILQTKLSASGRELVRTMLCELFEETARHLATATNFHRTTWQAPKGSPEDEKLMALH